MLYVLGWFVFGLLLYWSKYAGQESTEARLHEERGIECMTTRQWNSIWNGEKIPFKERAWYQWQLIKLLGHTFFNLHCPWSWERCVPYRVEYARLALRAQTHKLGWTVDDTFDPSKHDAIARTCMMSRWKYWRGQILWITLMPLFPVVCLIGIPLWWLYQIYCWIRYGELA